jgi:hypothetical protein
MAVINLLSTGLMSSRNPILENKLKRSCGGLKRIQEDNIKTILKE